MAADQKSLLYKEKATHGTPDFPLGFYEVFPDQAWDGIRHHWHEELEILCMTEGRGEMRINMESFPVDGEALFFVNPGDLHSMTVSTPCRESAILFHPRMLCFDSFDLSQGCLLQPLVKGELVLPHALPSGHPAYPALKETYLELARLCHRSGSGLSGDVSAQLFLKAGLLKMLAIFSSYELLGSFSEDSSKVSVLKTALAYIRAHYAERIYVHDLAGLAGMNDEYFCRFFKQAIGQSPIAYLNEYRIRRAVFLLQETDQSVTDICLLCGFNHFGNFLREFKKHTGVTPLKYRQSVHSAARTPSAKKSE